MNDPLAVTLVVTFVLVPIIVFASAFVLLIRPWMQVFLSGGKVSLLTVVSMRLRGMPVKPLCDSYVRIVQCGGDVDINQIQKAHLMGANVDRLARAVCLAKQSGESFVWDDLVATSLAEESGN